MPRLWLIVLAQGALTACTPPPDFVARAPAAREACHLDDLGPVGFTRAPVVLEEGCARHLARDLRVDRGQMWHLEGVDPLKADPETRGGALLRVAWLALAVDLGPAEDLGLDLPTDEPTAGGAVYDYVAGLVTDTRGGRDERLWARLELRHRRLEVHRPLSGVFGLSVLLHEARHGETEEGHVPCPFDPTLACDADVDGPYAWQAALLQVAAESAHDPGLATDLHEKAERYGYRAP